MADATTTLPGEASSVRVARRWAESVLSGWGHPDLGWTAACVVSELATNCHLHARSAFTLSLSRTGPAEFLLEISDGSSVLPLQRSYGDTATTGRGLALVAELGQGWGVVPHADRAGKTVWVRLRDDAALTGPERDVDALLDAFGDGEGAVVVALPPAERGPAMRLELAA